MIYKEIDLTPVSNRIVEQAFASAQYEMSEEQKQKLIQDKFERAATLREALRRDLKWHTER
jgi:hypothetical protein